MRSTDHASVFMSRRSDPASVAHRVCFTTGWLSNRTSELGPSPSWRTWLEYPCHILSVALLLTMLTIGNSMLCSLKLLRIFYWSSVWSRTLGSADVGHMTTASIMSSCHMTSSCPVADPSGDILERTISLRSLNAMPFILEKLRRGIPSPSPSPEDKKGKKTRFR